MSLFPKFLLPVIVASILLGACGQSSQQTALLPPPGDQPVATTVGDIAVSEALVTALLRVQGRPTDNPQMTAQAIRELENLVLLSQQAQRVGLTEKPEITNQLAVQRLMLLAQHALVDYAASNPVSDQEIEAQYRAQIAVSGESRFKVRHMLASNEDDALELLSRLMTGSDWAEVEAQAAESLGEGNVGELGWLDLTQLPPEMSTPIKQLTVGEYTRAPVATRFGYHLMYLEDQQPFEPPPLEDVREGIENTLKRKRVDAYLSALREAANIERSDIEEAP